MDDGIDGVTQEDVAIENNKSLLYSVDEKSPIFLAVFLGIQQYLTTIATIVSIPLILGPALCILPQDPALGQIASTIFLLTGISTILQCFVGIRLPVIQGPSFAYMSCILGLLNLWTCPSNVDLYAMGAENRATEWQSRIQEIQGALICVAIVHTVLGFSGIFGLIIKHISPLTIASTISLVGLTMMSHSMKMASGNWYLAIITIITLVIFSQILSKYRTPIIWYTIDCGFHIIQCQGFRIFSILIAVYLIAFGCFICTRFCLVEEITFEYPKLKLDWLSFPYPFQWGWPRFAFTSIVAIIPAVFVGIIESISHYYACASICGKLPPKLSAVNRGIGIEGISSLLCGLFGAGPGMASYNENIGTIGITQVGNRRVVLCGSIFIILLAIVGPMGILFSCLPIPLIGGLLCVLFSMVTAVGLSHLQYVNMASYRNMFVLGSSIFFGIAIPMWIEKHQVDFLTGYFNVDQTLQILLSNHTFIAAFMAFLLDSVIPGADKKHFGVDSKTFTKSSLNNENTYDIPEIFTCKS